MHLVYIASAEIHCPVAMPVVVFPPKPLMIIRIAEMKAEEGTTVQEAPSQREGDGFSRRWAYLAQAGDRP